MSKDDISPEPKKISYEFIEDLYLDNIRLAVLAGIDEELAIKNIISLEIDRTKDCEISVFDSEYIHILQSIFKSVKEGIQNNDSSFTTPKCFSFEELSSAMDGDIVETSFQETPEFINVIPSIKKKKEVIVAKRHSSITSKALIIGGIFLIATGGIFIFLKKRG